MDNLQAAKKIGYILAFKAITLGLITAYLIMAVLAGADWIFTFEYTPTLLFAAIMMYLFGFLFGSITGRLIIIKKYPAVLLGILSGFLIACSATFMGSLIGFYEEGVLRADSISESVDDYILKPILIVALWGGLPIILIGTWYGLSVKKNGRTLKND